ncbi:hypothetical protein [Nocardia sp. NPDC003963]
MTSITRRGSGSRALLGAVCASTALVAGCSPAPGPQEAGTASAQRWSPTPHMPGQSPRPELTAATALPVDIGQVDRADPDATARAALTVWFSWNPNVDAGPNDAAARAAPLLSAALRESVTATAPVRGPGADWRQWADRYATAAVRVDPAVDAVPPQTPSQAIRVYAVTQSWFAPGGEPIQTVVRKVGVVLARTDTTWEVNHVEQR